MKKQKPGPSALLPLAFTQRFLQWGAIGLIIPVSNLLRQAKGLSLSELGFSTAIISATIVILEVPTGIMADTLGRKRTYLASLAFSVASCAMLLVVDGFALVTLGFALYGVSRALASGSMEALLIDRYVAYKGKDSLHRLMSIMSAADTAGLALGSLAGGFIPQIRSMGSSPAARLPGRYDGNLLAMILILIVLAFLTVYFVSEERIPAERRPSLRIFIGDSMDFLRSNSILALLLAAASAWGFAISAVETFWQPRVVQILGSDEATWIFGALSSGYFLCALAGSLLAPLAMERTKITVWWLLFVLRILTALFVALLALQRGVPGFALVYLLMFLWNGMTNPPENTALNLQIPAERRASMLSVASLAVQTGGLLGAASFGFMALFAPVSAIWFVAAIVFGASAILYPLAAAKERSAAAGTKPS